MRRVRYIGPGVAPTIVAQPPGRTVTVGAPATFEVSASGTAPLAYRWQRDGVDIPGATSATYRLEDAELDDDGAEFRAVVTNGVGEATSDAATLAVTTNRPPVAAIDAPLTTARYSAGQAIAYAGRGSDPDGAPLTYRWRVDFHHESHSHPFLPATEGGPQGSFRVPTRGETSPDVWYRIHLTVTDAGGLTGSAQRDVLPRTATLRLAANVAGAALELDGRPFSPPRAVAGVVGLERSLAAPSPQTVGGRTYEFVAWSDGRARSHAISTPAVDTTYTAAFRDITAGPTVASTGANPLVPVAGPALPPPRLSVRAPARVTWATARGRGIPVRVRGVPGARVRAVVRAGRRGLGSRSLLVGPSGSRLVRVRVRRGGPDRRRVRLEVSAVMPGGRRLASARAIVLLPRG